MNKNMYRLAGAVVLWTLTAAFGLTGCGGSDSGSMPSSPASGSSSSSSNSTSSSSSSSTSSNSSSSSSASSSSSSSSSSLVSIAVAPQGAPLQVGKAQQFTAKGSYSDGSLKDITSSVMWSAGDATVASISATGLATAVAAGHSTITAASGPINNSGAVIVTPSCGTGSGTVTLGGTEEHLLQVGQFGTEFTPDEHLTYARQADGSVHMWIAGGTAAGAGQTIGLVTNDLTSFAPLVSSGGNAQGLLGPSGPGTENFDADYAGPGAIIKASNGTDLLMFYHAENHEFGGTDYQTVPFYASIGLARSTDNGITWTREGQIITGMTPKPANASPSDGGFGAANPSAIVTGGYIYIFYVDLGGNGNYAEVIHVARALQSSDGAPGSWQKYYSGSFSQPGLGGQSTAVQGQVPPGATTISAGNPDVSYNTYLQKYVLLFDTNVGWYYSTSTDLVNWTLGPQIFSFPSSADNKQTGDTWYSYATLVSPEQANEQTTSCAGYLYYAKGVWNVTPHSMYRQPFSFQ